jgi:hypothetical protein
MTTATALVDAVREGQTSALIRAVSAPIVF